MESIMLVLRDSGLLTPDQVSEMVELASATNRQRMLESADSTLPRVAGGLLATLENSLAAQKG